MKYELPQIIILTDKELMANVSTFGDRPEISNGLCTSCGFHVF